MKRGELRRRLVRGWWWHLLLALAPLLLLNLTLGALSALPWLAMPLFIAGTASIFVTLLLFHPYKRALIATAAAFDTAAEPGAWAELARRQRLGLIGASLPAWIAALAVCFGLEAVALALLVLASCILLLLYRLPRQLG